ncbi:MAG: DNA methyltransferase, partial [Proteobacteria bacterium]|nr:DNA methyltransferase [Pseudomonadota bacterium]
GFELMMAPYTIAHLRLGIAFRKTGFWDFHRRLGIYLTNSLEKSQTDKLPLAFGLAESIAEESKEAAVIKNEIPIMVVIGNPPYSGVSSNETEYANSLVERYKVEPGGQQKLQERKHWLNDDYVKFIAFAESTIEKTGDGILAMITNNGYLDNPTFRGMRWHLAKTFDKIYLLDLHGNVKKKETVPDGGKDENVFDIMQGVGIILAVKTGKKKPEQLGEVYHADLYGTRKHKFKELAKSPKWQKLTLDSKMVYFVPKVTKGRDKYDEGIKINELFLESVTGIVTMGDDFIVDGDKNVIAERVQKLARGEYNEITLNAEFKLGKNYAKFVLDNYTKLKFDEAKLVKLNYRPFDERWTYFDNKVLWRWREGVMQHLLNDNIAVNFCRQVISDGFSHIWLSKHMTDDSYVSNKSRERGYCSPLYLYHKDGTKTSNLKKEIVEKIEEIVGKVSPEDIFDYIYAVLHSPRYREKYKEFLKIDFPRVPYPKDKNSFKKLVKLGTKLRNLHLLESPKVNKFIITYPTAGSDTVEKRPEYKGGKVFINDEQYFGKVPEIAWHFYIGGYQPAQKWLKDRKGRALTNEDVEHYQRVIVALVETGRIMEKIDRV